MAAVVFLRGTNVGGHRIFRPSDLAKELTDLGVVNLGAAGTFVVRRNVTQALLRREILRRLPFAPEIMISPAHELLGLVRGAPFGPRAPAKKVRRFVSVMEKSLHARLSLPIARPAGGAWEVKIVGLSGRYALSLWRRRGKRLIYPNEVVEAAFGVRATTRAWATLEAICRILESD